MYVMVISSPCHDPPFLYFLHHKIELKQPIFIIKEIFSCHVNCWVSLLDPLLSVDPHGVVPCYDVPGVVDAAVGHEGEGGVEGSPPLTTAHRVGGQQGAAQPYIFLSGRHLDFLSKVILPR